MRKFCLAIVLICYLFFAASCLNDVNKSNYVKIKSGMTYENVVKIIGEADQRKTLTPDLYHNCYYWFDKATTLEEAKEIVKNGGEVYYIAVMTTINDEIIIGKSAGYVKTTLEYGDISVNV